MVFDFVSAGEERSDENHKCKGLHHSKHCLAKVRLRCNIVVVWRFNFSLFQEYVGQHVRFLEDAMCRRFIWNHSEGWFLENSNFVFLRLPLNSLKIFQHYSLYLDPVEREKELKISWVRFIFLLKLKWKQFWLPKFLAAKNRSKKEGHRLHLFIVLRTPPSNIKPFRTLMSVQRISAPVGWSTTVNILPDERIVCKLLLNKSEGNDIKQGFV